MSESKMHFNNWFKAIHKRKGKVIGEYVFPNGVTDEGANHSLDVTFLPATTQQTWYIGLLGGDGTLADTDTMSSHSGWTEFVGYSEATRPAWGPDSASTRSMANSTSADFTINASGTIKGTFLTSDNTKSGTTGILFSTALQTPPIDVLSGDAIEFTYTMSLT